MKTHRAQRILALLGVFALAACDDSGTELAFDDILTLEEQMELEVLGDPGSLEIALELTQATNDVAFARGNTRALASRDLNAQARSAFTEARDAMLAGDPRRALDAARLARRLVAQALREIGGDAALEALIERIEALALTAEDDVFDDSAALRTELEALAAQARELLAQGDTLAAAARALLGEQRARHRRGRRDHPGIDVDRARLAVSLARTARSLAERLIGDDEIPVISAANTDVADRQKRWLEHAKELLEKAEEALSNGNLRRAVHFAQHAHWSALKAVVLPGGITEEEVRAMVDLAQRLFSEAESVVGDEASELDSRLLERARDLIERGIAQLEEGNKRGVAALWRAAVISLWLTTD